QAVTIHFTDYSLTSFLLSLYLHLHFIESLFFLKNPQNPSSTLFPYTTLFRSSVMLHPFRVSSDIRLRPGFVIYDFYGITLTLNQVDDTLQDIIRQHQVYFFLSPPYTTEFILSVMEVPDHLLQGIFPLLIRQKITGL